MIPILATLMLTTPAFSVASFDGAWWLVDPDGRRFQSIGPCCTNRGLARDKYDDTNPGYAAHRFYPTDEAWAKDVSARLRRWGMNTVGAWSDHALLGRDGLYHTPVLHLSAAGIPWVDMWEPATVEAMQKVAEPQIAQMSKVPGVVGYFSDNELGWWIGALFEWGWRAKPESEGRAKLVALTREHYPTWSDLQKDFEAGGAADYAELSKEGRLYLRPGGEGMRLIRAWLGVLAERYYSLCKETIARYAPNALYLGDRYISGYYPEVAAAAGRHCDVVSTNLNADWPQGEFSPYFLDGLWNLTHRPIMITEYYACSTDNRSGNMNDASGFPVLPSQRERALSARRQTLGILRKPYVVGAHWFQYYDEPTHGREDGENYNMGLVDIDNKPYESLVRTFRAIDRRPAEGDKGSEIPFLNPVTAHDLASWPHVRAARKHVGDPPRGDLFVGWNASGLYVAAYWKENRFADSMYVDGKLPDADRAVLKVKLGSLPPIEVKIGDRQAEVAGARLLKLETGVNNTVVLRVAARDFGTRAFAAGRTVSFQAELATQARAYKMRWEGTSVTDGDVK